MPRRVVPISSPREARLGGAVEGDVVGHDHVRRAADADARRVDAALREHRHLVDERARVDHDAVADDGRDVRVEHAAGHEVQLEHLVAEDHGVAGVVAALVAHDQRDRLGEQVGGLALALVAPLQADDDGGRHQRLLAIQTERPPTCGSWTWLDSASCRARGAQWKLIFRAGNGLTGPLVPCPCLGRSHLLLVRRFPPRPGQYIAGFPRVGGAGAWPADRHARPALWRGADGQRPPVARTMASPIARPRPAPPCSPSVARWKRSKMRSRSASGMPGP